MQVNITRYTTINAKWNTTTRFLCNTTNTTITNDNDGLKLLRVSSKWGGWRKRQYGIQIHVLDAGI